jgi:hypothetical protein
MVLGMDFNRCIFMDRIRELIEKAQHFLAVCEKVVLMMIDL